MEAILNAWEGFARSSWPGPLPDSVTLRNNAQAMLKAVAKDMASPQSATEQKSKSEGRNDDQGSAMNIAALRHALARVNDGFNIERLVAEFRALRASVNRIWWESVPTPHKEQIDDMGRFNEALDELVAISVKEFMERVEESRQLFLGILGHDLRQPLNAAMVLAEVLAEQEAMPDDAKAMLSSMRSCCASMAKMVSDLLDFTSCELGTAIPVQPVASNLEAICREVLNEVQTAAPAGRFHLKTSGALDGEWDACRLRQMISNLLSNAVQHGSAGWPIEAILRGFDDEVTLTVHNTGRPIPRESMNVLFDPLVRLETGEKDRPQGSIGLGLYICRQIAVAHGGRIDVESSAERGTAFTVTLPKRGSAKAVPPSHAAPTRSASSPENMSAADPEEPWINSCEACRHLGISIATLHRWVKKGKLQARRTPGGVFRFRRSHLNELLR